MAATDDTQLLERLLAGEQSFKELVSTYQSAMRGGYAIVGQRHADEVVQDAWLSVVPHR
jgi:RNA polymerase sigma-70 factor (ECF subfamily)